MVHFGTDTLVLPLLAQQNSGPLYGNREAYEGGRKVGEIAVYVMIAVVVVWGVSKLVTRFLKR